MKSSSTEISKPLLLANKGLSNLLAYYAMVVFGFCMVVTGATLPQIMFATGISAAQAGLLTSMWGLGYLVCTAIGGILADRVGNKGLILSGALTMAVALFMFGRYGSFWLGLLLQ